MSVGAPRLTDGRVTLRPQQESDVEAHARAFVDDPDLARLLGYERATDADEVRRRIARPYVAPPELRSFEFAIADARDDGFLGTMMIHSCDWWNRRAEVGFWVVPRARGQGVLAGALTLVLDWAFGELGLERMELTALTDNAAIAQIARRFGFTHEGTMRKRNRERGVRVDLELWSLLRDERLNTDTSPAAVSGGSHHYESVKSAPRPGGGSSVP